MKFDSYDRLRSSQLENVGVLCDLQYIFQFIYSWFLSKDICVYGLCHHKPLGIGSFGASRFRGGNDLNFRR